MKLKKLRKTKVKKMKLNIKRIKEKFAGIKEKIKVKINKKMLLIAMYIIIALMIIIIISLIIKSKSEPELIGPKNNSSELSEVELKEIKQSEYKLIIYYFWGEGCPRCDLQKPFMKAMEKKYDNVEIKYLEVFKNTENKQLLENLSYAYGEQVGGAPITFIGEGYPIIGFGDNQTTGKIIEERIIQCLKQKCLNPEEIFQIASNPNNKNESQI